MEKITNFQKLNRLSCKFDMYCNATLDDTCNNLFRKEYTEIMLIRDTKSNELIPNTNPSDEQVKRMQDINKVCKAIVQQVKYNLNK
tara:strand:- start:12383 stop:12640 length:258 start_codon:yes stop_codon:yes gene_type:complete